MRSSAPWITVVNRNITSFSIQQKVGFSNPIEQSSDFGSASTEDITISKRFSPALGCYFDLRKLVVVYFATTNYYLNISSWTTLYKLGLLFPIVSSSNNAVSSFHFDDGSLKL